MAPIQEKFFLFWARKSISTTFFALPTEPWTSPVSGDKLQFLAPKTFPHYYPGEKSVALIFRFWMLTKSVSRESLALRKNHGYLIGERRRVDNYEKFN